MERRELGEKAGLGTGRFSAVEYGKALQDAFLKSDDPAKKTAMNTKEANITLKLINIGIGILAGKPLPKPAGYSK